MVKFKERILVTAALPYVNNVPHLGNLVGSHLPADIYARFCRLKGYDTLFIGGTDEHGTPIEVAAKKEGVLPRVLCDKYYKLQKKYYDWFAVSYDNFSRTSKPIHHDITKEFFSKIYKNGYIFDDVLKLPYCKKCERFLPDRFVEGECPYCGQGARGDQCDHCTKLLNPDELINPYCIICNNKPEIVETKHLFLDLSKLSPKLKKWIIKNKHWKVNVRNLALGWIKEGLKPRCITRDLKWGVGVPIPEFKNKVFYVWFDAPIGYISSTKEWAERNKKDFKKWLTGSTKIIHFIGKDNIPFHTIFWPGMLIAEGGTYNLPWQVAGLEYLNFEGRKFSKSKSRGIFLNNVIDLEFEPDIWRYYLSTILPETSDTDFSWDEFQARVNNELIGNLGNFVNRILTFINKNFNGKAPKSDKYDLYDKKVLKNIDEASRISGELLYTLRFRDSLREILHLSSIGNKYFQDKKPWENKEKSSTTLYVCLQIICKLGVLITPYLPNTSEKIKKQLNLKDLGSWDKGIGVKPSHKLGKPEILFKRIEDKKIKELKENFGGK